MHIEPIMFMFLLNGCDTTMMNTVKLFNNYIKQLYSFGPICVTRSVIILVDEVGLDLWDPFFSTDSNMNVFLTLYNVIFLNNPFI